MDENTESSPLSSPFVSYSTFISDGTGSFDDEMMQSDSTGEDLASTSPDGSTPSSDVSVEGSGSTSLVEGSGSSPEAEEGKSTESSSDSYNNASTYSSVTESAASGNQR